MLISMPLYPTTTTTRIKYGIEIHYLNGTNRRFQDGTLNGFILSPTTTNYSPIDIQATRYPYPTVQTLLSPLDALAKVRSSAGASKSRDSVDNYLINTELASFGKIGALITDPTLAPINGPGTINGGTVWNMVATCPID